MIMFWALVLSWDAPKVSVEIRSTTGYHQHPAIELRIQTS